MDKKIYFKLNGKNLWNGGLNYIEQLQKVLADHNIKLIFVIYDIDSQGIRAFDKKKMAYVTLNTRLIFKHLTKFLLKLNIGIHRPNNIIPKGSTIIYHGLIPINYLTKSYNTLYWLPDLLHKVLPENFGFKNYILRDCFIRLNLRFCKNVLLSSFNAGEELDRFYSISNKKIYYRFSSEIEKFDSEPILSKPYVLVPHEFWSHKRQDKVVDLAKNNPELMFVFTGNQRIHKKNSSWNRFCKEMAKHEPTNIITLGEVNWDILINLYLHASFVCNPSDYEGWNTSVEMGKSINKPLLLSKIQTHVEQVENYPNVHWIEEKQKLAVKVETASYSYANEIKLRQKQFCEQLQSL